MKKVFKIGLAAFLFAGLVLNFSGCKPDVSVENETEQNQSKKDDGGSSSDESGSGGSQSGGSGTESGGGSSTGGETKPAEKGSSGLYTNSVYTYATFEEISKSGYQPSFALGAWEGSWCGVDSTTNIATIKVTSGNWHGATLAQKPDPTTEESCYDFSDVSSIKFYIKSANIKPSEIQFIMQGDFSQLTVQLDSKVSDITDWAEVRIDVSSYSANNVTVPVAIAIPSGTADTELYIKEISFLDSNDKEVSNIATKIDYNVVDKTGDPGASGLYTCKDYTYATFEQVSKYGYQPDFTIGTWESAGVGVDSSTGIATIKILEGNWHGATLGQMPTGVNGSSYYDFTNVATIQFYIKSSDITSSKIGYYLQGNFEQYNPKLSDLGVADDISEWTKVSVPVSSYSSGKVSTVFALGIADSDCKADDVIYVKEISFLDSNGNEVTTVADKVSYVKGSASSEGADTKATNVGNTVAYVNTETATFTAANPGDASSFTTIVWSDEFNGDSVDTTNNWVYETGTGDWGWGNNEQETYTAGDNAEVKDGCLHITAKSDLTSTRMKTYGKKSFLYGKIEARMRFDQGAGSWPAFWMLGDNYATYTWPKCGEIDIMEHPNAENYVNNTLHWNYTGSALNDEAKHGEFGTSTNSNYWNNISIEATDWHTYTCEWTNTAITMYVDGVQTYQMTYSGATGCDCFNKPFFILFNFAMGGLYVNNTDSSTFTNLPWNMYVDYVRVYQ